LKYQLQLNKINRAIFLNTIKPGLNFFIIGIGGFLTGRLNTIFLQEFHTSKSVGLYTVAIAIPNIIAMIPAQIAVVLYPRISNCKDRPTAIAFGIKILRLSFVMLIILVSFFILISDLIINYFYGNEYTTTYFAVKILVLSSLFTGINSIIINILAGMGNSKYGLYNTIVIIISLSLLSFLTYLYNFEGAALSSLLANIISTIVLVKAFLRFCNKNIKDLIINKSDFRDTLTNFHDILLKKEL
jgi:O-antigen/teichoic acid export membrane protein